MRRVQTGLDLSTSEICDALNRCYEGYIVPFHVPVEFAALMNRVESVDLSASLFVNEKKSISALALIGRRGQNSRLAAFAVAPERRGTGLGKWLLEQVLNDARKRNDAVMDLEVIIGNTAAEKLYRRMGFEEVSRLRGYLKGSDKTFRAENANFAGEELEEVEVSDVARAILNDDRVWPWQQSAGSVIQCALPVRGWRYKSAFTCSSDVNAATVGFRGLAGTEEDVLALLRALAKKFPGKAWRVIPTIPEDHYRGVFEAAEFDLDEMAQFWMRQQI